MTGLVLTGLVLTGLVLTGLVLKVVAFLALRNTPHRVGDQHVAHQRTVGANQGVVC